MKEASFWKSLGDGKVQCLLCPHRCVMKPGKNGFCRVRKNIDGTLYNESYGAVTAVNVDPIEKKPLYHFKPGGLIYSIGTYGCNLACDFCQNHEISQGNPPFAERSPWDIITDTQQYDSIGVAYTYSEPTTWIEFVMDVSRLNEGYNVLVTNGYINEEPLKELSGHIDAANVDVKGHKKFYRELCHSPYIDITENVRILYDAGVHVEVTNLIVPGHNDTDQVIRAIVKEIFDISPDIPLHFSRFFPHFKMMNTPPTPLDKLEMAYHIAKQEGMNHVYLGNVQGMDEDTKCPNCDEILIERSGFLVERNNIKDGKCPNCGQYIYGKW